MATEPLTRAWSVRPAPSDRHFQGGDSPADCPDCGEPLHLIWDLDPTDPALTDDPGWPRVVALLGGSDRLLVVFCFRCWDTMYRLERGRVLPVATAPVRRVSDPPYPGYPAAFPRASVVLGEPSGGSQLGGPMHRLQEPIEVCPICGAEAMLELAVVADDGLPLFLPSLDVGVAQLGLVGCSGCQALVVYSEAD